MSDFHLLNKVTLGEMSKYGPSLGTYNGQLALAWIGTDGYFNLLLSTDGVHWGSKRFFGLAGTQPYGPPALGAGGSGLASSTTYVASRDAQSESLVLLEMLPTVEGGEGGTGEYTVFAPSLSSKYIAWTGTGAQQLNVATVKVGVDNGYVIPGGYIAGKITSSESSDAGPCLCDFNGETLIGWRGSGNVTLNIAQVSGGHLVNKHVIGQYSDHGPALASVGSSVYLAWTGSGNPQLNLLSSYNGYEAFGNDGVLPEASDSGPALAAYNNDLFLAWRGSGNDNLNVAKVSGPGLNA